MKFLKGLALSLLGFLLFLSLSLFGLAFTLNSTVLNPNFMTSEINRLEINSLVKDFLSRQAPGQGLPKEYETALINILTKLEPQIKENLGVNINSTYDYLLGEKTSPELVPTLRKTFLNANFVAAVVKEIDVSSLAGKYIRELLAAQLPKEVRDLLGNRLNEVLDDVISQLEPWVKEQVVAAADPIFAYLVEETQSFKVAIPMKPLLDNAKEIIWQAFSQSPPPPLNLLPKTELRRYFDEFYQGFTRQLPATFEINEKILGTSIRMQITLGLAQAGQGLEQARQYVGEYQLYYRLLIGFILLLILLIVVINREVRGATRNLGTTFLTYGAIEYVGIFVAQNFALTTIPMPQIPLSLETWLNQFLTNLMSPLQTFSLAVLVAGVALLIVSFVYKPRQPTP